MKNRMQALEATFDEKVDEIGRYLLTFPWENKAAYTEWLAQTFFLVRNTTRFISLAAANAEMSDRELHYEMIGHLKGELNHDLVVLNDLKAFDMKPEDFTERVEIQLIRQTQYFWLDRGPAASLCGYALLLEGLASKYGPPILERLEKAHGKKNCAFMRLHCEVDVEHYAEGLKTIAHLSEQEADAVEKNLLQSALLYSLMAQGIAARAGHAKPTKIAA